MNKLFRPKCMRRMAVFMALVAPIVYLFGSLFFALNGAHGTQVFAEVESTELIISPSYLSNVAIDGNDGTMYTSSGRYTSQPVDVSSYVGNGFTLVDSSTASNWPRAYYYASDDSFISWQLSGFLIPSNCSYMRVVDEVNTTKVVFGGDLVVPVVDAVNNSQYIFGQFFAKDNFLVLWGENAISENPYGFAPFGYFWRYLDTNFLHLSNEQVGLMGYGYMYYAAHVLLFDVGFILVTFFINVIQKVTDKIGGGDL